MRENPQAISGNDGRKQKFNKFTIKNITFQSPDSVPSNLSRTVAHTGL